MGNVLSLAPALPAAVAEKSYTEMALATLEEARAYILKAEKSGAPCTHVVICLAAEFERDGQARIVTQWCTSELCSDFSALGVMQLVGRDMFDGS